MTTISLRCRSLREVTNLASSLVVISLAGELSIVSKYWSV